MPVSVKPLRDDLIVFVSRHGLLRKFEKQVLLFQNNPRHPSLHTEILEPKHLKLYSFRIDRKFCFGAKITGCSYRLSFEMGSIYNAQY